MDMVVTSVRLTKTTKLKLDLLAKLVKKKKYELFEEALSLLIKKYQEKGYEIPEPIVKHSENTIESIVNEFEEVEKEIQEKGTKKGRKPFRKMVNYVKYLLYRSYKLFFEYTEEEVLIENISTKIKKEWEKEARSFLKICVACDDLKIFDYMKELFTLPSYLYEKAREIPDSHKRKKIRDKIRDILERYYANNLVKDLDESLSDEDVQEKLLFVIKMLKGIEDEINTMTKGDVFSFLERLENVEYEYGE